MKKAILFLIATLALGVMSCDSNNPRVDVVVISHGQMQFYNHATHKLTPYEAETDSVVNVLFDKSDHMFYTAAHQQSLTLKSLDLSVPHPQPKVCANWNLTLLQITDMMYETGAMGMFMDESLENLYLMRNIFDDDDPTYVEVYNIASGTIKGLTIEEYEPVNSSSIAQDHFYNENGKFYYVSPEGRVCLTDQIDLRSENLDGMDLEDLYYSPSNMSRDGKKIVFASNFEVGEGYGQYCVADSDGQHQMELDDSNIWTVPPQWLADGSLVYVGGEPRPESDPTYDPDWNATRYCIKIMDPQGKASLLASDAEYFYVNPIEPLKTREKQASLQGCEMAIVDNGKLTFYNPTDDTFVPFVIEKDYVVSASFFEEDVLYYTVAIGDELYLKKIFMAAYLPEIILVTDWDLKLGDCYSEVCGKTAKMECCLDIPLVGIETGVYEEVCVFTGVKYYNAITEEQTDYWPDEYGYGDDAANEEQLRRELGLLNLSRFDLNLGGNVEENALELYSISPTHECFAYATYLELGPTGGQGPLCFATVDGKVKMVLEGTDVQNMYYGWLSDGRLAYTDQEGIKVVSPDGTITQLSSARMFVTVH